jgi:hypothetical protein
MSRSGLLVLVVGVEMGVLAYVLLRAPSWGVNVSVLALALAGALVTLQHRHGTRAGQGRYLYAAAAVVLAAGFAWRDSAVLQALGALALLAVFGLLASEREAAADGEADGDTLSAYAVRALGTAQHAVYGAPVLVFEDVR